MKQAIPLATSIVTLIGMYLAGRKRWEGWAISLANQVLWAWFIVAFRAWGLIPLSATLSYVYALNLRRWRKEDLVRTFPTMPKPSGITTVVMSMSDGTYRWNEDLQCWVRQSGYRPPTSKEDSL
jgi:hypothetical protein